MLRAPCAPLPVNVERNIEARDDVAAQGIVADFVLAAFDHASRHECVDRQPHAVGRLIGCDPLERVALCACHAFARMISHFTSRSSSKRNRMVALKNIVRYMTMRNSMM